MVHRFGVPDGSLEWRYGPSSIRRTRSTGAIFMKVGSDKTIHSAVVFGQAIVAKGVGHIHERSISLNSIADPRPMFIRAIGRQICFIGGGHGREYCVDTNVGELQKAAIHWSMRPCQTFAI